MGRNGFCCMLVNGFKKLKIVKVMERFRLALESWWTRMKRRVLEKNHLLLLFGLGVLIGLFLLKKDGKILQTQSGFMDECLLAKMKTVSIDKAEYLSYVFGNRLWFVCGMVVMATTYLGSMAAYLTTVGLGTMMAVFLRTLIGRYGLKGFILALGSLFPQYILYFPAFFLLNGWCISTCRLLHGRKNCNPTKESMLKGFQPARILGVLLLTCMGCILEVYINVDLLQEILRYF